MIDELRYALTYPHIRRRLKIDQTELKHLLMALDERAEITPGILQLPGITRDLKDDAVVACAVEGRAAYVVSGDKDILELKVYQGITMVSPAGFIAILQKNT